MAEPDDAALSPQQREQRGHLSALRTAQALGRTVVVHLRDTTDMPSPWVTGPVQKLATTGAYAIVGGTHVPIELVLRVEQKVTRS